MQKQAKLIQCLSLEGEPLQFVILCEQQLGKGYFGTVKKAYERSQRQQPLAVKIIPYSGDQQQKQNINAEVQILKTLCQHPNLVKVYPLKCWSENNFYIFMEYCPGGTLLDWMMEKYERKQTFTEEEIFKVFYQVLSGYEVLWKKKILHQDLKPDNILIKDGVCKLTDFGFSIFHEGVILGKKRKGTLEYMPLEKLIRMHYEASTKSDVYAIGVIIYRMITGRHPYVNKKYESQLDFIDQLRLASLMPHNRLRARMSLSMQNLFDVITKMVTKKDSDRVDFDYIYEWIGEQVAFLQIAKSLKKEPQLVLSQPIISAQHAKNSCPTTSIHFVEYSRAFVMPFSLPFEQQQQYQILLKNTNLTSQQNEKQTIIKEIDGYLCSMRLKVFFFDRLARRLVVEKLKEKELMKINSSNQKKKDKKSQVVEKLTLTDKVIISLLYLATKITTNLLAQTRHCNIFSFNKWKTYRTTNPYILELINKDSNYLKHLTQQLMIQLPQHSLLSTQRIIEASKLSLQEFVEKTVHKNLLQLIQQKAIWMDFGDRKKWVDMRWLLMGIDVCSWLLSLPNNNQNKKTSPPKEMFEQKDNDMMETYLREIDLLPLQQLYHQVTDGLSKLHIQCSFSDELIEQQ